MKLFSSRAVDAALVFGLIVFAATRPAYAYLDPGTGSYLFQIAIAGIFGALFALKSFWKQIRAFMSTKFQRPESKNQ